MYQPPEWTRHVSWHKWRKQHYVWRREREREVSKRPPQRRKHVNWWNTQTMLFP